MTNTNSEAPANGAADSAADDVIQISVFVENRAGRAAEVCRLLQGSDVNVCGFMISDTNDYGILRIVCDRPERALRVLEGAGYAAKAKPILAARLDNVPGNLSRLLDSLAGAGVNLIYSYSLISTFVALAVEDLAEARRLALSVGIDLVGRSQIAAAERE